MIIHANIGNSPCQMIHQTQSGAGAPTDRQRIPLPDKPQDAQIASAITFHQVQDEEEDPYTLPEGEEDEDPYTLLEPVGATPQQNAKPTYYKSVPRDPIACSENQPEIGYSNTVKVSGAKLHTTGECTFGNTRFNDCDYQSYTCTAERATDDVSSTDEYSCSTCSHTGDSGFSDSRAFLKELPSRSRQLEYYQREQVQGSGIDSSAQYTSLISTDVHTGHYTSLNPESRIPGIGDISLLTLLLINC